MTSIIKVDEIQNKAGTTTLDADKLPDMLSGSTKSWINFDGTGTIATRDSFNVSSLTDLSTGQYRSNFTNNMVNDDYACSFYHTAMSGSAMNSFNNNWQGGHDLNVAYISHSSYNGAFLDSDLVMIQVNGDLA